jgi:hypothetical protein
LRPIGGEYDEHRLRIEETVEEMLHGQDLASRWVDIDDADGLTSSDPFELAGADLAGDEITVPVIPKQTDEFMCSSCFLIHHVSRLASSKGSQLVCTDCV